jgi:hypothetical protein
MGTIYASCLKAVVARRMIRKNGDRFSDKDQSTFRIPIAERC